jgi:hypothetical protein
MPIHRKRRSKSGRSTHPAPHRHTTATVAARRHQPVPGSRSVIHPEQFWYRARYAVLLIPVVQVAWLLWFVWNRTSRVPYSDEWETISIVMKAKTGHLQFLDFWELHNEHRILIPRLIDLILIEITRWNRQIEMTFDLALASMTLVLLVMCIRKTVGSTNATLLLLVPISLLYFSFSQGEDWFAPFQIQFYLTTFGVALCMCGFSFPRSRIRAFTVAVLGALIASYSSSHGLIMWAAFLPFVWMRGWLYTAAWVAIALAVIAPYLVGFHSAASSFQPFTIVSYVLAYLGAPIGSADVTGSQWLGVAGLIFLSVDLVLYLSLKRELTSILNWICLGLFALGSAGITAWGRSSLGVAQALASRYQAFSVLWWIAVVVVGWLATIQLWRDAATRRRYSAFSLPRLAIAANASLVLLTAVGAVKTSQTGYEAALAAQSVLRANESCIRAYATAPDSCLELYYPIPSLLAARSSYLARERLNIFVESERPLTVRSTAPRHLIRLQRTTQLAIDAVAGQSIEQAKGRPLVVQRWRPIDIGGWAIDARSGLTAGTVFVLVDGQRTFSAQYGWQRPDVARTLGVPTYVQSGYDCIIPAGALQDGNHRIQIRVLTHDLRAYFEPSGSVSIKVVG